MSILKDSVFFQKVADILFPPDRYLCITPLSVIGHLPIDILQAVRIAKREHKKLVVIPSNYRYPANWHIFDCSYSCELVQKKGSLRVLLLVYLQKVLRFKDRVANFLLHFLAKTTRLGLFLKFQRWPHRRLGIEPCLGGLTYRLRGSKYDEDVSLIDQNSQDVVMTSEQEEAALSLMRAKGIPIVPYFIVLHVREKGFKTSHPAEDVRNGEIDKYLLLVQYVQKKGGMVYRIGGPSHTYLPKGISGLFDLANFPNLTQSERALIQLYLCAKAYAYVGSSSGPLSLARMFSTPALVVAIPDFYRAGYKSKELYIPKHVAMVRNLSFLSVRAMFEDWATRPNYNEYVHLHNLPVDICAAFCDLEDMLSGKPYKGGLLEEYYSVRHAAFEKTIDSTKDKSWSFHFEMYSKMPGRIAPSFLQKYWEPGPALDKLQALYFPQS